VCRPSEKKTEAYAAVSDAKLLTPDESARLLEHTLLRRI